MGQINVISGGGGAPITPPDVYTYPADWIDVRNPDSGKIEVLVSDRDFAAYGLYVITTDDENYTVNWGDGTTLSYPSDSRAVHKYTKGTGQACSRGYTTFKITISGNLATFRMAVHDESENNQSIGVLACGINSPSLIEINDMLIPQGYPSIFCPDFEHLTIKAPSAITGAQGALKMTSITHFDISAMVNLQDSSYMFSGCKELREINLETISNITNPEYMFGGCWALEKIDISTLTKATTLNSIFGLCPNLKTVITASSYPFVLNINNLFFECASLKTINMTPFKFATTADNAFQDCKLLETVEFNENMLIESSSMMFSNCGLLKKVDISKLVHLINANSMFSYSLKLETVIMPTVSTLEITSSMFSGCRNLLAADLTGLTNVTNSAGMFNACSRLKSINISPLVWVTDASYMFQSCFGLETIIGNNFAVNSPGVDLTSAFSECENLKAINIPSAKIKGISANGSGPLNKLEALTFHALSPFNNSGQIQLDLSSCTLTADQLNTIFTALPTVSNKGINLNGTTGAATCNKTIATSKGWQIYR